MRDDELLDELRKLAALERKSDDQYRLLMVALALMGVGIILIGVVSLIRLLSQCHGA
jgi:hypothetical protein